MYRIMNLKIKRVIFLIVIVSLSFSAIVLKTFFLTMYKKRTVRARTTFERGLIKDRKGRELALNLETYSIYCNPKQLKNKKDRRLRKLAEYLEIEIDSVHKKVKMNRTFVWLKRKVARNVREKVIGLGIKGINFVNEYRRFYPNKFLASQVIGFVGVDNYGLGGIELSMDKYLKGDIDDIAYQPMKRVGSKDIVRGKDVYLTIDKFIQYITDDVLKKSYKKYLPDSAMALVMNTRTGEILSMSSLPSFDPNFYNLYSANKRRNIPVSTIFEPGSTFKPFIAAAVVQEGICNKGERFECKGRIKIGDKKISCWDEHGLLKIEEIMKFSCNVGMIKMSFKLKKRTLYGYLKNFGFGTYTGIKIPGESAGILRRFPTWTHFSRGAIAIGQELAVTAVQLLSAGCAIVNDGVLMQPKIVYRIIYPDGTIYKDFTPFAVRRAISKETADRIIKYLRLVVEKDGTGENANIPGYFLIGKTGTAQIPDLVNGGYYKDKKLVSFIGFLISDFYKLGIVILLENPHSEIVTGGAIAAPIFKNLASRVINYLDIPSENIESPFSRKSLMKNRYFKKDSDLVPDFSGMTMREVTRIIEGREIEPILLGTGFAYKQSPAPGTRFSKDTGITVWFKP